jgi:hypothetical protein
MASNSKRLEHESFRKRRHNYLRRGNEISSRYNVAVWICIRKQDGQLYIYNSDPNHTHWPPSFEQLVGFCVGLISSIVLTSKKSVYPAPIIKTPDDFTSGKQAARGTRPNTTASLPGHLTKPPIPEYSQEEIFSGRLLERYAGKRKPKILE